MTEAKKQTSQNGSSLNDEVQSISKHSSATAIKTRNVLASAEQNDPRSIKKETNKQVTDKDDPSLYSARLSSSISLRSLKPESRQSLKPSKTYNQAI